MKLWYKKYNRAIKHEAPCEVKMGRDSELDRLKSVQDEKYHAKQRAYEVQDSAWKERSAAKDRMNAAYDEKQSAYEAQNSAWERYQSVRSSLGSRIDSLKSQQEQAYQNMKQAFDNASSAHSSRDGAASRRYADEGHSYKAEAQRCTNERRGLVDQIRSAKAEFERYKAPFQDAKSRFADAKREFEAAKAKHERARDEFRQAKKEFDIAKDAFKSRLEKVKADSAKRRADNRAIAVQAGVPSQYVDNVWVKQDKDGNYNIYFGGIGQPDGEGHGHYVLSTSGKVTYARDPHEEHGSHNYTDQQEKQNHQHNKFPNIQHGTIDGELVTFALGVEGREGEILLSDGHKSDQDFREKHDHYGSGDGPKNNGTDRGHYTGPGSE